MVAETPNVFETCGFIKTTSKLNKTNRKTLPVSDTSSKCPQKFSHFPVGGLKGPQILTRAKRYAQGRAL